MKDLRLYPILHTNRLLLRKLEPEDFPSLIQLANDREISQRIINIPFPYREHDAAYRLSFIVKGYKNDLRVVFAVILKSEDRFIGEIGIHFLDQEQSRGQLSYWTGRPYWNKGIITEAIESIIDYGFNELNLDLIFADCHADNIGSRRVLEKNDFSIHSHNQNLMVYKKLKNKTGK